MELYILYSMCKVHAKSTSCSYLIPSGFKEIVYDTNLLENISKIFFSIYVFLNLSFQEINFSNIDKVPLFTLHKHFKSWFLLNSIRDREITDSL